MARAGVERRDFAGDVFLPPARLCGEEPGSGGGAGLRVIERFDDVQQPVYVERLEENVNPQRARPLAQGLKRRARGSRENRHLPRLIFRRKGVKNLADQFGRLRFVAAVEDQQVDSIGVKKVQRLFGRSGGLYVVPKLFEQFFR